MVYPKATMAHRVSSEIQSVTSNSKSSEDEYSQGGRNLDSTDDEGGQPRVNGLQRRSKGYSKGNKDGGIRGYNGNMSEEPKPVQGGTDDVVRLSHIASIVVKEAPATEKASSEPHGKSTSRSNSPVPETSTSRGGRVGRSSTRTRSSGGAASIPTDDIGDDGDDASDCEPMDTIMKSPYEPTQNAEKGIKVFTDMKNLLAENHDDNLRSVGAQAARVFGPTNAWCLVKTNGTSSIT